ncbi:uncharacterized protein LOC134249691 isoform X2 [Saccostrea cucullata]|uniref:uncharacterized protein LOC134249691 isoform X2 n=1 Tax=Saccostrea cuccullata TaxID=36930 RepID=UPI002ED658A5
MENILVYGFILSYVGNCFAGNQTAGESIDYTLYLHVPKISDLPCLCQLSTTNWTEPTNIHISWASPLPPGNCGLNIEIKEKESIKKVKCDYLSMYISLNDSTPLLLTLVNNSDSINASFHFLTRSRVKIHIRCLGPNFSEDSASTFTQTLKTKRSFSKHTTLPLTLKDRTKDNILGTCIYISVPTAVLLLALIIAFIISILIRKSRSKNNTTTKIHECSLYETEASECRQYTHVYDVINKTNNYEQ